MDIHGGGTEGAYTEEVYMEGTYTEGTYGDIKRIYTQMRYLQWCFRDERNFG